MRILVVSQYFDPENFRINDLVAGLVEHGHEVTVLTGQPNYPFGSFFPGYGWFGPRDGSYSGAKVVRVPLFPRGGGGRVQLVFNYLSFAMTACWGVLFRLPRSKGFDAIFVFEPSPITVGIPAVLARWKYRAPMLFWVLDLWPDSLAAVGAVRSPWLLKRIDRLVGWIYSRCDLILVQSRSFIPNIMAHDVDVSGIRYFPNWGEPVFVHSGQSGQAVDLDHIPEGFRIFFAGNIGAAQDFPAIIAAADLLGGRTDIQWVIAGDGRMAEWVRAEISSRGLDRTVHLIGQHPPEKMPDFFATADALLVSLKRDPIFSSTVPGKLQSYLASGKPVLAMLDGEGARIVSDSGAGLHCPAGDPAALAHAVERLAAMSPEEREKMGTAGRDYFEKNFSRDLIFNYLEVWLAELTQGKKIGNLHD